MLSVTSVVFWPSDLALPICRARCILLSVVSHKQITRPSQIYLQALANRTLLSLVPGIETDTVQPGRATYPTDYFILHCSDKLTPGGFLLSKENYVQNLPDIHISRLASL